MIRSAKLLALLLLTVAATACEVMAPLVATTVDITGPKFAYGTESSFYERDNGKFFCEYTLYARAHSFDSQNSKGAEWVGAVLDIGDSATGAIVESRSLSRRDVEQALGWRIYPGSTQTGSPFKVYGNTLPFVWKITVTYFDPVANVTQDASFSSECRSNRR